MLVLCVITTEEELHCRSKIVNLLYFYLCVCVGVCELTKQHIQLINGVNTILPLYETHREVHSEGYHNCFFFRR